MRNKNAKKIISSYRKKQKTGPYIVGGIAILLAIAGIVLLVVYLTGSGGGGGGISLFKTKTPTPTATANAPFEYQVQEGDNCTTIAENFEVDIEVLLVLNNLDSTCFITPGQTILIPAPGQELPTATPLPSDIAPGTKIEYHVRAGDSLYALAEKFNSTVERILNDTNAYRRENDLDEMEDENDLNVGDIIIIPVNIVTPQPTTTSTPTPSATPTP